MTAVAARADAADGTRPTSSLSWVRLPGAEACLPASELSTRVEAKLGRAVFVSPSVADVAIEARAEVLPSAQLHVVIQGTRRDGSALGTRELSGPDCKSLEDSLVLVLALMIDRDASPAKPPPVAPTAASTEVVRERVIVREVHEAPTPPARDPWTLTLVAAAQLDVAMAPKAAPAIYAAATVDAPHGVPLQLGFDALPTSSSEVGTRRVDVTALAGQLAVCPRTWLRKWLRTAVCGGVRVGAYAASGYGFAGNTTQRDMLADLRVAPQLQAFVAGPVFVHIGVGLVVPLVRQKLTYADATGMPVTVFQRPLFDGDFGLGVGMQFLP